MQRLISPWEYRHFRGFGITRIAAALSRATSKVSVNSSWEHYEICGVEIRHLAEADLWRGFWGFSPLRGPGGPGNIENVNARFLHQVPEADGGTAVHEYEGIGRLPDAMIATKAGCRRNQSRMSG